MPLSLASIDFSAESTKAVVDKPHDRVVRNYNASRLLGPGVFVEDRRGSAGLVSVHQEVSGISTERLLDD
jgi:hypothetical protein